MIERPILFSGAMVRAILEGRKHVTRRPISPPPASAEAAAALRCPYGRPGTRLWVRETWRTCASLDHLRPSDLGHGEPLEYLADPPRLPGMGKTRVSIHMPRWASRITLAITHVRAERLHELTEQDATAEGVPPSGFPRESFRDLWDTIHGHGAWDANPWIWRLAFRRMSAEELAGAARAARVVTAPDPRPAVGECPEPNLTGPE